MPTPPPAPRRAASEWTQAQLVERPEWHHALEPNERQDLWDLLNLGPRPLVGRKPEELPLPHLQPRLQAIQDQLEHGAGVVRLSGFPCHDAQGNPLEEAQLRSLSWALFRHLGTPVSQSPQGEQVFSVRDAGFAESDPRSRGPNTRKRLSFHTDRADVVGFVCHRPANQGGENEVASSIRVYREIQARRPDLLEILMEPFHYLRHSVDHGNEKPWCRLPVFSFHEGHFACCFLRVLIDRAHKHPDLPSLTPQQIEALDQVEAVAAEPNHVVRFRQESGDVLLLNNWLVLHRRARFEDDPDPEQRRHILRVWLSMPNSRPLDPCFVDHFGATAAGAIRGGMPAI